MQMDVLASTYHHKSVALQQRLPVLSFKPRPGTRRWKQPVAGFRSPFAGELPMLEKAFLLVEIERC